LPYVCIAPNIVQIFAFLNSRDWLLKCASFESADFQMSLSPSDISSNLNIFFVYCKVLAGAYR
jgi:hypothetical protein